VSETVVQKFLVILLLGAIALAPLRGRAGDNGVILDYDWWSALSSSQQLLALESALQTYGVAYTMGAFSTAGNARMPLDDAKALVSKDAGEYTFSQNLVHYQSAITSFYARYPKAHRVSIGAILVCLADAPTISCETVASSQSS